MDSTVAIPMKYILLFAALLLGGNGAESVLAAMGWSPTVAGLERRLSNENQGFTYYQIQVLEDICGFPGPIRDPDQPRPRPRPR